MGPEEDWLSEEDTRDDVDGQIDEYDLTSTPNDFNVITIYNFVESGSIKIPSFQRNYVWDMRRASKLIESIIIGLPVPQLFLYEEGRNSFLVIDGQQRLMTIYYFIKQRFPRKEKRAQLRRVFSEHGHIPDDIFYDDDLFENFKLRLAETSAGKPNKFAQLNYSRLGDYRSQFDLRPIRNVIVKQVAPSGDDSSIYEIFNRLNTGGVNLAPQEIRASLYNSKFYDMLFRVNMQPGWRAVLGAPEPDINMRDIEILLRAVAVWREGDRYKPSMVKFLNKYSKSVKSYDERQSAEIEDAILWFLRASEALPRSAFSSRANNKFSTPLFESIFAATCRMRERNSDYRLLPTAVEAIKADRRFQAFANKQTTNTTNVKGRLAVASEYVERYA